MQLHHSIEAKQQQAQMDIRAQAFFTTIQRQPQNKSAEQFDQLGAALGFLPNSPLSLNTTPVTQIDAAASKQYRTIQPALNHLLTEQLGNTQNPEKQPIPSVPTHLKDYLTAIQPQLSAIQVHLLEQEPPQWEINMEKMSDEHYLFPGLTNVLNTQKLLLLSALWHNQQNQQPEMLSALEASWKLNQAIAQRPDLVGQTSASVAADYQARLLRHTQNLPQPQLEQWQLRLSQQAKQQSVLNGFRFDIWLQYQTLQKSLSKVTTQSTLLAPFSPVHRFTLVNIDSIQTAHRAIDVLNSISVCETSQPAIEAQLSTIHTAPWNEAIARPAATLAEKWKKEGDRALSLELTQQALKAQQYYQKHQQWPAASSPSTQATSTACPNEYWISEQSENNTLTIRLSTHLSPAPSQPLQISLTASNREREDTEE